MHLCRQDLRAKDSSDTHLHLHLAYPEDRVVEQVARVTQLSEDRCKRFARMRHRACRFQRSLEMLQALPKAHNLASHEYQNQSQRYERYEKHDNSTYISDRCLGWISEHPSEPRLRCYLSLPRTTRRTEQSIVSRGRAIILMHGTGQFGVSDSHIGQNQCQCQYRVRKLISRREEMMMMMMIQTLSRPIVTERSFTVCTALGWKITCDATVAILSSLLFTSLHFASCLVLSRLVWFERLFQVSVNERRGSNKERKTKDEGEGYRSTSLRLAGNIRSHAQFKRVAIPQNSNNGGYNITCGR